MGCQLLEPPTRMRMVLRLTWKVSFQAILRNSCKSFVQMGAWQSNTHSSTRSRCTCSPKDNGTKIPSRKLNPSSPNLVAIAVASKISPYLLPIRPSEPNKPCKRNVAGHRGLGETGEKKGEGGGYALSKNLSNLPSFAMNSFAAATEDLTSDKSTVVIHSVLLP